MLNLRDEIKRIISVYFEDSPLLHDTCADTIMEAVGKNRQPLTHKIDLDEIRLRRQVSGTPDHERQAKLLGNATP